MLGWADPLPLGPPVLDILAQHGPQGVPPPPLFGRGERGGSLIIVSPVILFHSSFVHSSFFHSSFFFIILSFLHSFIITLIFFSSIYHSFIILFSSFFFIILSSFFHHSITITLILIDIIIRKSMKFLNSKLKNVNAITIQRFYQVRFVFIEVRKNMC